MTEEVKGAELDGAEIDSLANELANMMRVDGDLTQEVYDIVRRERLRRAEEDMSDDEAEIEKRREVLMNHVESVGGDMEDEEAEGLFENVRIDQVPGMVFFKYCEYVKKKVKKNDKPKPLIEWLRFASSALRSMSAQDLDWVDRMKKKAKMR